MQYWLKDHWKKYADQKITDKTSINRNISSSKVKKKASADAHPLGSVLANQSWDLGPSGRGGANISSPTKFKLNQLYVCKFMETAKQNREQ